jgi:hypothetical protein
VARKDSRMEVIANGALLHVPPFDEIVETATYMDGFLLGVVVRRNPGFRASLYRVWPRTFKVSTDLPEIWSPCDVSDAICESIQDGLHILRKRVETLEDQDPQSYRFQKTLRTSWPNV